jgi:signal transduction histidine kinase
MSLERRLLAGIAVSLLLAFGILLWLGGAAVRQLTEDYVITRLQHDSEALLGRLASEPGGRLRLPADTAPVYRQPLSGHYFVVLAGDQRLASRSLWDETLPLQPAPAGSERVLLLPGPGQQQLLALVSGYRKLGHDLTLLVAEDVTPTEARIGRYQWLLTGLFLGLAALLLLVLRLLLRRGFSPLDRTRRELQRVADGSQERLDAAVPDEIRPLVDELNRLLALLTQRLARSRNALGNLAHALKTPLSLVVQELEQPELDEPRRQVVLTQAGRIRDLVDRELRRARLAGSLGAGQHFDARTEVPALCQVLERLYADRRLTIEQGELPVAPLAVDREDMLELLGNLLDNACKWAGSRVRLTLSGSGTVIRVCVEDDGPGVSDGQLAELTARGRRLDERHEGHGLGLAIVHDIVALYGGTLSFARSAELGGLRVQLQLGAAAAPQP